MPPQLFPTKEMAEKYLTVQGYVPDTEREPIVWVSRNGVITAQVIRQQDRHGAEHFHLEYSA